MTSLIASILASIPAWGLGALLEGHVSEGTGLIIGFVAWAVFFVPAFVFVKRLREGG